MEQISATEFKAQCLSVMDKVANTGQPVIVTKHGKPVVKVVPAEKQIDERFGSMKGKFKIVGDIINTVPLDDWNCS
jgi:prevent-host-death family protein